MSDTGIGGDKIERETFTEAPIERVWTLASEPGWFIGTLLRVVESGFASLYESAEQRAAAMEDNTDGWQIQLDVVKRTAEQSRR